MRIQYGGDKIKIIPKKYSVIKDIGKFFMADSKRLTVDERAVLDKQLAKIAKKIFDTAFQKEIDKLDTHIQIMIWGSPLEKVVMIKRRTESSYSILRFMNHVEIRCEDYLYKLGIKAFGVRTETLNRSY